MAASPPTTFSADASTAVMRLALQVGATPVAHVGIATMLSGVCSALPPAVGVAAAALLLTEPADPRDPEGRQLFASDDAAHRLGLIQHRAGRGPVPAALRGDRPLVVPDLTVGGPPELAAAAADCGLVRSLVVPLPGDGQPAGGLQLLGGADTTLDEQTAAVLWPLVAALSARLADARELGRLGARLAGSAVPEPEPEEVPYTTAVPAVDDAGSVADGADRADDAANDAADDRDAAPAEGASAPEPADPTVDEETVRLHPVTAAGDDAADDGEGVDERADTYRDPLTDLFAAGGTTDETPPTGQAQLGWEGPEHTPRPTPLPTPLPVMPPTTLPATPHATAQTAAQTTLPTRALPSPVPMLGRAPRPAPGPVPAAVPAQRTGPVPAADPEPVAAAAAASPSEQAVDDGDLDGPTGRVPRHRLRED